MGLFATITPENRNLNAERIDLSLRAVNETADQLQALASKVKLSSARLLQLKELAFTTNEISIALFEAINCDGLFCEQIKPVINLVEAEQRTINYLQSQHNFEKNSREGRTSGNILAAATEHIASNLYQTLENCLRKEKELNKFEVANLKHKVYGVFDLLDSQQLPLESVQDTIKLQEDVGKCIENVPKEIGKKIVEEKHALIKIDFSGSLIFSSITDSQKKKILDLEMSLNSIQICIDVVNKKLITSQSRVEELHSRLKQLEKMGGGVESISEYLRKALIKERSCSITIQIHLDKLNDLKSNVEIMFWQQRLPNNLRFGKKMYGKDRIDLAEDKVMEARGVQQNLQEALDSVHIPKDDLIEKIQRNLDDLKEIANLDLTYPELNANKDKLMKSLHSLELQAEEALHLKEALQLSNAG